MERGLNAELTEHLGYEKHATEGRGPGNSGNGSNAKTVSTIGGDVDLAMNASRHPASADFGLMGVATTLIGLLPTYATIGVWAPAGLGDPHVFDDRPPQYVAHYLLGARLHDPNWTVLRTAIGNVFRNVPIAHPLSGFSISYAIGAILGGAFAPTIAQYLVGTTGWIGSVGVYLGIMATISGVAILTIEEPRGTPLSPEQEQSQEKSEPVSTPEAQKAGAL